MNKFTKNLLCIKSYRNSKFDRTDKFLLKFAYYILSHSFLYRLINCVIDTNFKYQILSLVIFVALIELVLASNKRFIKYRERRLFRKKYRINIRDWMTYALYTLARTHRVFVNGFELKMRNACKKS